MIEFDIAGNQYRAGKLNAFQQLHVSRKIAPLIPALIPVFLSVSKMPGRIKDNIMGLGQVLQPFADGISSLPDDTLEYVISTCLSVVKRHHADVWAPVWSQSAKSMMFDDINDMGTMIPLVVRVIQSNLAPFISGLLTSQQTEAAQEEASPGGPSQAEKTGS
jgi:hypothetical protein